MSGLLFGFSVGFKNTFIAFHRILTNLNASTYTYMTYGLVGFYGISTIVGYLMPNPLYTYILNIYDLGWLGFMAYQPL